MDKLLTYIVLTSLLMVVSVSRAQQVIHTTCKGGWNEYEYVTTNSLSNSFIAWSWNQKDIDTLQGDGVELLGNMIRVKWNRTGTFELSATEITEQKCHGAPVTAKIKVREITINLPDVAEACKGDSATIYADENFVRYLWNNGATTPWFSSHSSVKAELMVWDEIGCYAKDETQIVIHDLPVVNLGNDTVLCGGSNYTIDAGDFFSFDWSHTTENTRKVTLEANYQMPQIYSVKVTDINGCQQSDTLVLFSCNVEELLKERSNAFSPNGDNVNDLWIIDEILAVFNDINIEVFDRWGNLVYSYRGSGKDYSQNNPWNGSDFKGRELPVDSYPYVITVNDTGGEAVTGTVTILK
ncbi:MAG: gliding motility-associated C-terminal domain-containing protein [Bacteroidales bacterium]|nr:gliding motility-associated C-terminal domain-containing protein [Bacteroidales bacterium]